MLVSIICSSFFMAFDSTINRGDSVHSTLFPQVAICIVVFGTVTVSALSLALRDSEILLHITLRS